MLSRHIFRKPPSHSKPLPYTVARFLSSTNISLSTSNPTPPSSPPLSKANLKILAPLAGSRCVITGASRGIGRATAHLFASRGARCVLIGRDESALLATKSACENASKALGGPGAIKAADAETVGEEGRMHAIAIGDVGSREFWRALDLKTLLPDLLDPIDEAESGSESESISDERAATGSSSGSGSGFGIDILVNAAGITHSSPLVRTTASSIEAVIQTNLMGTLWSSQVLGKVMLRRNRGVIVNIASLLATHGGAGSAAYVASKSGVVGLTRSLAAELGARGVRVNCLLPGYVASEMTDAMSPKAREEALAKIPAGRFGTAEEVAEAVLFLATNAYANNCVINLDGGLSAV